MRLPHRIADKDITTPKMRSDHPVSHVFWSANFRASFVTPDIENHWALNETVIGYDEFLRTCEGCI